MRMLDEDVEITTGLKGSLSIPAGALGVVIFAHGSGSSRRSPRNRFVAGILNEAGYGTLLVDLLTEREAQIDEITAEFRFNIRLLASRLLDAAWWLEGQDDRFGQEYSLGYFGASTGAAAALTAAAVMPGRVKAIVSRGGRPDLAEGLEKVRIPTLLIVGSKDFEVRDLNRKALEKMGARDKKISLVEGAGHLFEEPGTLEQTAALTRDWFDLYLKD